MTRKRCSATAAFLEKVRDFPGPGSAKGQDRPAPGGGSANLEMVINAQEAERQRLSRQMHDGPAQALSNFIVQTEIANRLLDIDPKRAKEELDNLKNSAMNTFKEVRTFIFELRPMMLDDLGLFPTVRRYVDNFKEQTGAEVNLTLKGSERRLESYLEVMIFRALQELLGNAFRHNQDNPVKPQINIQISMDENVTKVSVIDNGKGFDPAVVDSKQGLGLKLIRERVELLGGYLEIDSDTGQGRADYLPGAHAGSKTKRGSAHRSAQQLLYADHCITTLLISGEEHDENNWYSYWRW